LTFLVRYIDSCWFCRLRSKLKDLADQYNITQQKYAHQVCYLCPIDRSLGLIDICTTMT